jgi:hypothetical protein
VVTAITAAAPAWIVSGMNCRAAAPPAMFQRRCGAAHSSAPSPASSYDDLIGNLAVRPGRSRSVRGS